MRNLSLTWEFYTLQTIYTAWKPIYE
ncbi:hypothetical protein JMJ78_0009167 [Colletotrichum scovillei]|nr:hypothetical protein JMJ78_0009167 [Colletotrichum scovillei]